MRGKDDVTLKLARLMQEQSGSSFSESALLASLAAVVCMIAILAMCKGP